MPAALPSGDFRADVEHAAERFAGEEVTARPAIRVFDDVAKTAIEIEPHLQKKLEKVRKPSSTKVRLLPRKGTSYRYIELYRRRLRRR